VLGQALGTYLVCEGEGELVLVDQHAAHERINFERLRLAARAGRVPSQRLLVPVAVTLEPRLESCAREQVALLAELGFEVEPFGGGTVTLRAVPELLRGADPGQLLSEILEELASYGSSERLAQAREQILARLACHGSVRAGRLLEPHEAGALLASLDQVDFSHSCPHGRPVAVRLERAELERRFGRS
jgi:DNA mismatch repair protein MutL